MDDQQLRALAADVVKKESAAVASIAEQLPEAFPAGPSVPVQPLFSPKLTAVTTGIDGFCHERAPCVALDRVSRESQDAFQWFRVAKEGLFSETKERLSLSKQDVQILLKELPQCLDCLTVIFRFFLCRDGPTIARPSRARSPSAPFVLGPQFRRMSRSDA